MLRVGLFEGLCLFTCVGLLQAVIGLADGEKPLPLARDTPLLEWTPMAILTLEGKKNPFIPTIPFADKGFGRACMPLGTRRRALGEIDLEILQTDSIGP